MKKFLLLCLLLFVFSPVMALAQEVLAQEAVSINGCYDDLEAARQYRMFGKGIRSVLSAVFTVKGNTDFDNEADWPDTNKANGYITSSTIIVVASSHGDASGIYNCRTWDPIWSSYNSSGYSSLKGKIVHLLACDCGQDLVIKISKLGSNTRVLGYEQTFEFSNSSSDNTKHAECDGTFDKEIVAGKSVQDAANAAKTMFNKYSTDSELAEDWARANSFSHNRDCMVLYIDGQRKTISINASYLTREDLRPSEGLMKKLLVAKDPSGKFTNLKDWKVQKKGSRGYIYRKNMQDDDLKQLCVTQYLTLNDDYQLGLRTERGSVLLNKYQIMDEIMKDTDLGKYLVNRYTKYLDDIENRLQD